MNRRMWAQPQAKNNDRIVPSFLQKKEGCRGAKHDFSKSIKLTGQFQELAIDDAHMIAKLKWRCKNWMENTPRLLITCEKKGNFRCKIECPSKLLLQEFKFMSKSVRLHKIEQTLEALFELVDAYGYFYCDNELLRISEEGHPVVWINRDFCCCDPELPIKYSTVSELIFIEKVKAIFQEEL